MPRPPRRLWWSAVAALLIACRSGPALPPEPTSPAAEPAAGIAAASVRDVDWGAPAVLDAVRVHFGGGEVEARRVAYADLTGDGREEALVVVESGGTAGDLGAAVYHADAGRVTVLAWIDRAGHIELRLPNAGPASALVVVQQGLFAPGDAECCPSRIREVALRWDGVAFRVFGDQTLPTRR